MAFQTPMSALGLPQTQPRDRRNSFMSVKEASLLLRRRMVMGVALTALCACIMMTWHLILQLPSSETSSRRSAQQMMSLETHSRDKAHTIDERQETNAERPETLGFHNEKQIVMILTHFRDSDVCAQTLIDARATAFLASRVHFRVFEELYLTQEKTCVERFCDLKPSDCKQLLRSGQLRAKRRDASGAVGTTVARYVAEGMVEQKFVKEFYLSVDPAVVVFTLHWDLDLLKQWYSIGNNMAILSVTPKSVELRTLMTPTILVQCSARIHSKSSDAVVEFNSPELMPRRGAAVFAPVLQTQYSEVFHFGPVQALFDVRSDPHTPLITVGHEYARATRFWTRGYDFYAPNKDILFGHYQWQEPPLPMSSGAIGDNTDKERDRIINKANRRIRKLLGLPVSVQDGPLEQPEAYALGSQRSMAAWQQFSGVDPLAAFNETTSNHFTLCGATASGSLRYVPY